MHILAMLVFGLIVGLIARALVPGQQKLNWIATTVIGIIGSMVGGLAANFFASGRVDQPVMAGWIGSILGSVFLLFLLLRAGYVNIVRNP